MLERSSEQDCDHQAGHVGGRGWQREVELPAPFGQPAVQALAPGLEPFSTDDAPLRGAGVMWPHRSLIGTGAPTFKGFGLAVPTNRDEVATAARIIHTEHEPIRL